MLQRDYIMRLLQQFFEALEKLVEKERDKKGRSSCNCNFKAFIVPTLIILPPSIMIRMRNILNEMGQNYGGEELLTRIDMLSELLYQDALLKESERTKIFVKKIAIPVELFRYT